MLSVVVFPPLFFTFPLCNFRYPNPSDRLIFVKVRAKDGHFFGQKYEQNSSFCDWWQFGDGWGSVVVQNLPSERELSMGKLQKKEKKN